ncbi:hypothetical protein BGZ70_001975 [Mortierella alpina]|uniref:Zn(2)-C6 fungal-type domain-containing protein n=1 Tax=Mortierella alpina TaxID=64518 RepID=A0A9P6IY76_MORAP|nr:hypothetical protein BGZ70_001975 [Mortierella alpina]
MPMQVFEFQADTSVSLVSPAAINRKSCDHCFLNRKTCDKVRQAADSGDKCRRCAKDNRPCTFTPTVHLYHIADCVGRHQCRAKVIHAMGGRKKEVQFKTIEIPIICDMDSVVDQALFDFIQKQPNLLVYNNRIKSFLAQDMLGLSADHDDAVSTTYNPNHGLPSYSMATSPSPLNTKRSFSSEMASFTPSINTSPSQGLHQYRAVSPIDQQQQQPYQQHQRPHPYANHQRNHSDDRGRQPPHHHRPSNSPRGSPRPITPQEFHSSRHASLSNGEALAGLISSSGRLSPANSMNPLDGSMEYQQRRHSDNMAVAALASASASASGNMNNPFGGLYQQPMQQPMQQQQQHHPYAQQSPYPQAPFFHQPQPQPQFPQELQQLDLNSYRNPSPFPSSPVAPSPIQSAGSPHPHSPLDYSLNIGTNFGSMGSNSHQNLPSLFDTSLTMESQVQMQQQHFQGQHRRNLSSSSSLSNASASPMMTMASDNVSAIGTPNCNSAPVPPPMVITTTTEDGREVGFYYAVPSVNLNPNYSDADLFQDFTMMDALGEDFVWVENLFDDATDANPAVDEISATSHNGVQDRDVAVDSAFALAMNSAIPTDVNSMEADQWSSQYNPYESSLSGLGDESAGRISQSFQG